MGVETGGAEDGCPGSPVWSPSPAAGARAELGRCLDPTKVGVLLACGIKGKGRGPEVFIITERFTGADERGEKADGWGRGRAWQEVRTESL